MAACLKPTAAAPPPEEAKSIGTFTLDMFNIPINASVVTAFKR